jgi:hypothetical protein
MASVVQIMSPGMAHRAHAGVLPRTRQGGLPQAVSRPRRVGSNRGPGHGV